MFAVVLSILDARRACMVGMIHAALHNRVQLVAQVYCGRHVIEPSCSCYGPVAGDLRTLACLTPSAKALSSPTASPGDKGFVAHFFTLEGL